jgi:hypothetical protein
MSGLHPCQECGACCAVYRVQFHENWLVSRGGHVPDEVTEPGRSPGHRHMRVTGHSTRCVALKGVLAERVACSMYESRPMICRDFAPAWENGQPNPFCDEARFQIGLPPLRPSDFGWEESLDDEHTPVPA